MASKTVPVTNADPDLDEVLQDTEYEKMIGGYAGNGLIGTPTDTPHVYADDTGMQVKIRAHKYAHILGQLWISGSTDFTVGPVAANTTGKPRWDLVVLQMDRTNDRIIDEVIKQGVAADNPTLPTLTRDLDAAGDGGGQYELAAAKVVVQPGAASIKPTDVTPIPIYLAPQSLVVGGATGDLPLIMSLISPYPSLRVYQYPTKKTLIADGSGFTTGVEDTGLIAVPPISGWTSAAKMIRVNGTVYMTGGFARTGNAVAAHAVSDLASIPVGWRPRIDWTWGGYLDGANLVLGRITASGATAGTMSVYFDAVQIAKGASITPIGLSWPV